MKIDVIISADYIKDDIVDGKNVVVIDVLRATTVMVTALANGAKKVIPFLEVEDALSYKKTHNEVLLGGERRALKIDGFDFSNSPLEYMKENVLKKNIGLTTTNGTKALTSIKNAKNIFIASLINSKAVATKLHELEDDVVIINSGTYGAFSIDDFICSGYIISLLSEMKDRELTDIAITAKNLYEKNSDIYSIIKEAKHYVVLKTLGFEEDLNYCIKKDLYNIVPIYKDGEVKSLETVKTF